MLPSVLAPIRTLRQRLTSPGVILFVGLSVANASNYLFQVVMSRQLGPAEYSLLGSVFALVTVLGVSLSALQTASAKAVATNPGEHPAQRLDPLTKTTIRYGLAASAVVALLSPLVASFLHSGIAPGIALATFIVPAGLLAIGQGRLQGREAFTALALLSIGLALGRIVASAVAVALHLGVTGVVIVTVLTSLVGGATALHLTRHSAPSLPSAVRGDVVRASLALLIFWVMVSIDIPVARHYLSSADAAGQYAAASDVGKAVLWLPGALSVMMFPRVASRRQRNLMPHPPLVKAFGLAAALCIPAVLFLWIAGARVIPLFFGTSYAEGAKIEWQVGAACLPFALSNVLIFYHLTRDTSAFIGGLAGALIIEIAALSVLHNSTTEIVSVMGATGTGVLLAIGVPGSIRRLRKSRALPPAPAGR